MWIVWLKLLETLKIGHNLVCKFVKTIFNWVEVSTSLALIVEFLYILTKSFQLAFLPYLQPKFMAYLITDNVMTSQSLATPVL